MRKKTKYIVKTVVSYGREDLEEIIKAKESFKGPYGEAKAALKKDPKDYDAKVNVCFYRLLFKKLNRIIFVIRKKGIYLEKPTAEVRTEAKEEPFNKKKCSESI